MSLTVFIAELRKDGGSEGNAFCLQAADELEQLYAIARQLAEALQGYETSDVNGPRPHECIFCNDPEQDDPSKCKAAVALAAWRKYESEAK